MEGLPFVGQTGERLRTAVLVVVILLALFLGVKVLAEFKSLRYIGAGLQATNTISVSGYGEVFAVADIAEFSFTVSSLKPTVAAAQEDATQKINAITSYLEDAGIDEKDIKTIDYNVYPQYDYQSTVCPQSTTGAAIYCPPGRQVLRGYEVRQTTQVKVRDTAKAGDLLTGVGEKGATEVSGLNFTFDDPNAMQDEARNEAIADAKKKADVLARQLGVRLVRVVAFNEDGNYPSPMPYYKLDSAVGMGGAEPARAPEISVGQNKVTSNVSVTYEIR
ncbi:MAG TPA: SIMPL domain-containing protein [Candidatus Paceibacterota bacterium]|uniref:DUF541 domain-containing protein n=1 Tax=Candidatus Adlerbacteria bacterium RIFCSPLOWO2_01_FULL_51_16 TaxID=1797243 RepID=A0A1F4XHH0_9BACT|nr:MAG: hypothetical protein A2943_00695 [Candidatus Adlerbacteria bacterium RIFCSPLOWO2_01_FULL_51_16]HXK31547.1 SIMPL domain-containing protein [Candidatus Paceibacterota bacterium]